MTILSTDTSCDETSVAVTRGNIIISNVLWSQASMHSEYGGVFPSLAKRAHEEHIDWVIAKAIKKAFPSSQSTISHLLTTKIDAIAVTVGPGLAIALEVGINKAKELAQTYNKPLVPVNHVEGHLLSVLAKPNTPKSAHHTPLTTHHTLLFPAFSLVASGKHTDLILVKGIGEYEIIAHTIDDALGEALDKAARMLGLGYPGGAILEKFAKKGDTKKYALPTPLAGQKERMEFSYSGLKTAFYRLTEKVKKGKALSKKQIYDLAAVFQDTAFRHVENVVVEALNKYPDTKSFFFGGGVSANTKLRKRLRKICRKKDVELLVPYSKTLCTDNAGMIGVVAGYKLKKGEFLSPKNVNKIDREPRAKINYPFLT